MHQQTAQAASKYVLLTELCTLHNAFTSHMNIHIYTDIYRQTDREVPSEISRQTVSSIDTV